MKKNGHVEKHGVASTCAQMEKTAELTSSSGLLMSFLANNSRFSHRKNVIHHHLICKKMQSNSNW